MFEKLVTAVHRVERAGEAAPAGVGEKGSDR